MSQRIGYRQELANRYLEYMRQAETPTKPPRPPPIQRKNTFKKPVETALPTSASDVLQTARKSTDAAFAYIKAQRENDLGAAELERREKSGQRHSADGGGAGLRRPLTRSIRPRRVDKRAQPKESLSASEHFEKAVDKNEEMVARVQAGEAPEGSERDKLAEQRPTTSKSNDTIDAETKPHHGCRGPG